MKRIIPLFLLIFSLSIFSQKKDEPIQTKTAEVKLNLLVTDSNQKFIPIDEIKSEDIKLFEDDVEQKITYFQKKTSVNVGMVVDNTGSMRDQLDMVIRTAAFFTDNLRTTDEVFIVRFVSSDKISMEQNWTNDKPLLRTTLSNLYVEGGQSAVYDAIYLASTKFGEKEKNESKRNIIVLISDCEDRDSYYKLKEVLKLAKEKKVSIFVLGFVDELSDESGFTKSSPKGKATKIATQIAEETNGLAFFPKYSKKNQEQIIQAIVKILDETRAQYEIGYVSKSKKSNAKIRIEIANDSSGNKRIPYYREKVTLLETEKQK
jgi:Ca-activated chloride channel family protein